jgi:hypothetical protein
VCVCVCVCVEGGGGDLKYQVALYTYGAQTIQNLKSVPKLSPHINTHTHTLQTPN